MMLKIFTTQLLGVFQQIKDGNETAFEEAGRYLAQSIISDGKILVYGDDEMSGIFQAIVEGPDCLPKTTYLFKHKEELEISPLDCIIIAAPTSAHKEATVLAKKLKDTGATVIGMSTKIDADESLDKEVAVHIDLRLTGKLVPLEDMSKIGYPSTMTGLYGYYGLFFVTKEFLEEHAFEV
jgi:hypothetical protein